DLAGALADAGDATASAVVHGHQPPAPVAGLGLGVERTGPVLVRARGATAEVGGVELRRRLVLVGEGGLDPIERSRLRALDGDEVLRHRLVVGPHAGAATTGRPEPPAVVE